MRFLSLIFIVALYACTPASRLGLKKAFEQTEKSFQDHTGFVLYDAKEKKNVYDFNGSKYFTPGSNTKIFTFYAALRILGDSVPALRYIQRNDSLIFWGTGDPSFLYKNVHYDSGVYHFLKHAQSPLYFSGSNFETTHFGPGWAWDDYNASFSSERSPFPVYGNTATIITERELLKVSPEIFSTRVFMGPAKVRSLVSRDFDVNTFTFYPPSGISKTTEWNIPFKVSDTLIARILSDTLQKNVTAISKPLPEVTRTLYSIHIDSLYSVLMQESDNFIAEQLLLMCAQTLRDTLKPEITIDFVKKYYLKDLPDEPMWVDGSGLSRYNLFTPRSIVKLWEKIAELVPQPRLFPLLATGGVNGTVKNWYKADKPYLFGKTGSLRNNHCISGYMVTKSGKTLIFSFMNNNFTASTSDIRRNMQAILKRIYDKY